MLFLILLYCVLKSCFPQVILTIVTACKGFLMYIIYRLNSTCRWSALCLSVKPQFGITLLIFFPHNEDSRSRNCHPKVRDKILVTDLAFFSRDLVKLFESNTQLYSKNNLKPTVL